MNRNFFIRLTFAVHRVADALPGSERVAEEIRETANKILADLIILFDKEAARQEKKHNLIDQLRRQIDILLAAFQEAKQRAWVKAENFSLLESEYAKIRDLFALMANVNGNGPSGENQDKQGQTWHASQKNEEGEEVAGYRATGGLTRRQRKIVEFLQVKQKAQVWELQKVLPEVTKRTLRRDLDELLQKNLVERKGEWNAVSYELK